MERHDDVKKSQRILLQTACSLVLSHCHAERPALL